MNRRWMDGYMMAPWFWLFGLIVLVTGFFLLALVVAAYLIIRRSDIFLLLTEGEKFRSFCVDTGWYGPFIIIGFMIVAVVISPVPSAPIALASGMVYGNVWGTILVVIGAEAGAVIAFGIARLAGFEFLKKWIGDRVKSVQNFRLANLDDDHRILFASFALHFLRYCELRSGLALCYCHSGGNRSNELPSFPHRPGGRLQ